MPTSLFRFLTNYCLFLAARAPAIKSDWAITYVSHFLLCNVDDSVRTVSGDLRPLVPFLSSSASDLFGCRCLCCRGSPSSFSVVLGLGPGGLLRQLRNVLDRDHTPTRVNSALAASPHKSFWKCLWHSSHDPEQTNENHIATRIAQYISCRPTSCITFHL